MGDLASFRAQVLSGIARVDGKESRQDIWHRRLQRGYSRVPPAAPAARAGAQRDQLARAARAPQPGREDVPPLQERSATH